MRITAWLAQSLNRLGYTAALQTRSWPDPANLPIRMRSHAPSATRVMRSRSHSVAYIAVWVVCRRILKVTSRWLSNMLGLCGWDTLKHLDKNQLESRLCLLGEVVLKQTEKLVCRGLVIAMWCWDGGAEVECVGVRGVLVIVMMIFVSFWLVWFVLSASLLTTCNHGPNPRQTCLLICPPF